MDKGEAKVQVLERRKTEMEDEIQKFKYWMEEMKKNMETQSVACRRVLLPTVGQVKSPGEEATDRGEIISQDQQYHRGWTEIDQNCFQVAS